MRIAVTVCRDGATSGGWRVGAMALAVLGTVTVAHAHMQDRRTFLGIAAASLLPVSLLPTGIDAQTSGPRPPAELARHTLTGPLEGFEAVLVELNIPPGSRSSGPGHRHPGPVQGYVVEGQMRFAIDNEPEQVLPVGRTFFEPSRSVAADC